jgi:two-component system LytT family response regulator
MLLQELQLDGQDITAVNWRTKKSLDLLVYLAHINGPVTKERILEELWPNCEIEQMEAVFHSTVYRLRQMLQRYGAK